MEAEAVVEFILFQELVVLAAQAVAVLVQIIRPQALMELLTQAVVVVVQVVELMQGMVALAL
jgi:hypothetical protein